MEYLVTYLWMVLGHLLDGINQGGSSFIESTANFTDWLFNGFLDALIEFLAILFTLLG